MQHHVKHKVRTLVQRLNECVGAAARQVYTQQISATELLQCPQCDIRRQLPELCAFVDSLSDNPTATPPSSLVCNAFRHPDAQWISRSARESGVSALVCQQLVRLARQKDKNGDSSDETTIYWPAAELTMHVLLDALLSPCAKRLGKAINACTWCPTQPKPRFHAMTCFPVWSTLLPFAALMGLRFPDSFRKVLSKYLGTQRPRVNCDFAQIIGIWRLLHELNRGDKENLSAVTNVMIQLLQLASNIVLGRITAAKTNKQAVGSHLDDQLLEKFFTGMQEFAFQSWRANAVLRPALFGVLQSLVLDLEGQTRLGSVPQQTVRFMAVACMFVPGLAADIGALAIERLTDRVAKSQAINGPMLTILVGFCAHVDLASLTLVLELLSVIIAAYKAAEQQTEDPDDQRRQRRECVFYLVYVAYHRCHSVESVCHDVSSQAATVKRVLAQFQMRLCSDIAYEDLCFGAPLHWTGKVWKHWVFLSDKDVQTFMAEAEEQDEETEQEFEVRVAAWRAIEARIALKPRSRSLSPHLNTLLEPHFIAPRPLIEPSDEEGVGVRARKRRRSEKKAVKAGTSAHALNVLLLQDVMDHVCSFMSAKRLCRLALVCRTFADLSHRASLWQPLYLQIGLCLGQTFTALPLASVECRHGESYRHDWRHLYQERWKVMRRLRRLQLRARNAHRSYGQDTCEASRASLSFVPQLCSCCGCNHVLKSAVELESHQMQHKRLTCTDVSCRASFTNIQKFHAHMKQHVRETANQLECGFGSCQKRYKTRRSKEGNSHH